MGKVEVKVYEATQCGDQRYDDITPAALIPTSADLSQRDLDKKKGVLTGTGSAVETLANYDIGGTYKAYTYGALVDTITLHYCSVPGLIQVGVL
jgi:nicotinate-nucleotide pyrophosphorylase